MMTVDQLVYTTMPNGSIFRGHIGLGLALMVGRAHNRLEVVSAGGGCAETATLPSRATTNLVECLEPPAIRPDLDRPPLFQPNTFSWILPEADSQFRLYALHWRGHNAPGLVPDDRSYRLISKGLCDLAGLTQYTRVER